MNLRMITRIVLAGGAALALLITPPEVSAQQEGEAPVLAIPDGYAYDPAGRRDPFVDPVPGPPVEASPIVPEVRPPGLGGVLLNEASLAGVVNSFAGNSVVVVEAPGSRTFIAREGDELMDVVISEIRPDSVVFEVKPLDGVPEPAERERVVRNVNAAPGE